MNQSIRVLIIISILLCTESVKSQTLNLIKDINETENGIINVENQNYVVVDDLLFFVGTDDETGSELWVTDGTKSNTVLVMDIFSGAEGSDITNLISHNDLCYFFANDGTGKELWKSDGTEIGTKMVVDINLGTSSSSFGSFEHLISYKGSLYFEAFDGTTDQLWVVDNDNNADYFAEWDPDSFQTGISGVHIMNEELYFFKNAFLEGVTLFKYDGIDLIEIENFTAGNSISQINETEGILYYTVKELTNSIIWAYDSNADENKMLLTSNRSVLSAIGYNSRLIYSLKANKRLFSIGIDGLDPIELNQPMSAFAREPRALELHNGLVYYYGGSKEGISVTDGTLEGTEYLFDMKAIHNDEHGIFSLGNDLLISGEVDLDIGMELYLYKEGSTIKLVKDIFSGSGNSSPRSLLRFGEDKVIFNAVSAEEGRELWIYNEIGVSTSELAKNYYSVYPSIVTNSILINNKSNTLKPGASVSIYNSQGVEIMNDKLIPLFSIDTSNWVTGLYFISIWQDGNRETHKVLKI